MDLVPQGGGWRYMCVCICVLVVRRCVCVRGLRHIGYSQLRMGMAHVCVWGGGTSVSSLHTPLACGGARSVPHVHAPSQCIIESYTHHVHVRRCPRSVALARTFPVHHRIIHTPRACARLRAQCCTCTHPSNAPYIHHVHVRRCPRSAVRAHTLPMHHIIIHTASVCVCARARARAAGVCTHVRHHRLRLVVRCAAECV